MKLPFEVLGPELEQEAEAEAEVEAEEELVKEQIIEEEKEEEEAEEILHTEEEHALEEIIEKVKGAVAISEWRPKWLVESKASAKEVSKLLESRNIVVQKDTKE